LINSENISVNSQKERGTRLYFGLVEAALKRGDISAAISEVRRIKNDYYLFLGLRSIVRRIIQLAKESIDKFGML